MIQTYCSCVIDWTHLKFKDLSLDLTDENQNERNFRNTQTSNGHNFVNIGSICTILDSFESS